MKCHQHTLRLQPMDEPVETPPRVPDLGRFRLGEWSVRQAEGVLFTEDRSVHLEPRVMEVLACLAADPEGVVTKEELLAKVWGGSFVEEGALSQAIHGLRKALGDDARQPRYIQTIPKRGYRLLVPVEREREPREMPEPAQAPAARNPVAPVSHPLSGSRRSARLLQAAAGMVLALVLWMTWSHLEAQRRGSAARDGEGKPGIRIVVLPFEDVGKPEDPYFAAGLTEEITSNLTLLPSLQVIPGRNALNEKGVARPLEEIRKDLQADYVLQGRVMWRPGGRQVRVLPQLVRTLDDSIVLATPFEGEAHSPFKAQQEISRSVLSTLDVALTPEQSRGWGERSTESPDAYRAYVQGLVEKDQPFYSPPHLERAAESFEKAVEADPDFAEAWAELSQVHSYLAFNTDRSLKRREQARRAMEKAIDLAPDLVSTRLAQAYFSYRCQEDYGAALKQLSALAGMAPNRAEVFEMRGLLLRRTGHLPEAIEDLKRASALNPRTADLIWTIAETYGALRDYERADAYFERAIALAPDEPFNYEQRAHVRLAWTGNLQEARAILEDSPVLDSPQLQLAAVTFDLYERKFQQALTRVSAENQEKLSPADRIRLDVLRVLALERLGDHPAALALARKNLSTLELRVSQYSRHPLFRVYLALTLAQLDRGQEAVVQAEEAVRQSRHELFSSYRVVEVQAMVDATLGRHREAINLLDLLLRTSYRAPISAAGLRWDPVWDPLRSDSDFEKLARSRLVE